MYDLYISFHNKTGVAELLNHTRNLGVLSFAVFFYFLFFSLIFF